VGNFNSKIGREGIFKPAKGKCSLHQKPYENGIRVIDFVTNNNMIIESTYFPHKTYIRRLGNRLLEELIIRLTTYCRWKACIQRYG